MSDNILTLDEYFKLVRDKPRVIIKTAHQRIYDAIMEKGFHTVRGKDDPRLARALSLQLYETVIYYNAFKDFYGIERELEAIVAYFRAASLGGEHSRQLLCLIGEPSTGKSSIVKALYLAMDGQEIFYLDGCPMREEPLHLIPRKESQRYEDLLGIKLPDNANLCDKCRKKVKQLLTSSADKWKEFKVVRGHIAVRSSIHFASIDCTDAISFDKAKLIGSVRLGEEEGDPDNWELDGAFCRANRGLLEMVEIFKNTPEVLNMLLEATQMKTIESPAGRASKQSVDEAIVGHSNEEEYAKAKKDVTKKALMDRMAIIRVPHNIRLTEQIMIFEKMSLDSKAKNLRRDYHLAPHTQELAALFTVMSRLKPSGKLSSLLNKVYILNGNEVGQDLARVSTLKMESPADGTFGVSNREISKLMEMILCAQPKNPLCLDAMQLLMELHKLYGHDEHWRNCLSEITGWSTFRINNDLLELAGGYKLELDRLYRDYLDAIRLYTEKNEYSREAETLMEIVERALKVNASDKEILELRQALIDDCKTRKASEVAFEDAPNDLKKGLKEYLLSNYLPKILRLLAMPDDTLQDEGLIAQKEQLVIELRKLGYKCQECQRNLARCVIR